ncbi:hypothetical protein E3O53_04745 [Cryobacterium sp. TMT2-18-3]|uniref:hypothetical protein n=1 Tax=unclassified Cryobacterium TaxID=2649013 RepID=UPI001068D73C|nr:MULTISPECIES: hypothetical protein [unclassified Cryobacterium]TFC31484.1 hypothetical protein E3O22_02455 [Cryobacterium sp. TMT2-18-2]TFC65844.1 hypothetical protein E3O53_04745 [Cryobacterium sp. TMT2-18-3]
MSANNRPALAAAMLPSRPTADRLAITALWMGIVAFVACWLPVLGLLLASVGIVLGIIALRRSNRRELAQIGLILSIVAALFNVVIDVSVVVSLLTQLEELEGASTIFIG